MEAMKRWGQNHSWIVLLLTALSLVAGLFIYMGSNYSTVRETVRVESQVGDVDHKVYMLTETLALLHKEISNTKTMIVMLNSSISKRLDAMDLRLERIDDKLARLENRTYENRKK